MNRDSAPSRNQTTTTTTTSARVALRPALELRLSNQLKDVDLFDQRTKNGFRAEKRSIEVEQEEESRVHHRESFSSSSTTSMHNSLHRKAAMSSASEATNSALLSSSSTSRHLSSSNQSGQTISTSSDLSSSSRRFKTSASLIVSGGSGSGSSTAPAASGSNQTDAVRLGSEQFECRDDSISPIRFDETSEVVFSSPDVRSLQKKIDTHFAELENFAQSSTDTRRLAGVSVLSTRLFGRSRLLLPSISGSSQQYPSITSGSALFGDRGSRATSTDTSPTRTTGSSSFQLELAANKDNSSQSGSSYLRARHTSSQQQKQPLASSPDERTSGEKIKDLLSRAQGHVTRYNRKQLVAPVSSSEAATASARRLSAADSDKAVSRRASEQRKIKLSEDEAKDEHQIHCKAVISESIEGIDQGMSDLCKKLNDCHDTKEACHLMKIMIQMIEKAWSVPVCGDDLGFKLCQSLRGAGGLDILVGFIQASEDDGGLLGISEQNANWRALLMNGPETSTTNSNSHQTTHPQHSANETDKQICNAQLKNKSSPNPLRLNLSKLSQSMEATNNVQQVPPKDTDSDIMTSDLGLDSNSVESDVSSNIVPREKSEAEEATTRSDEQVVEAVETQEENVEAEVPIELISDNLDEEEASLRKEELVFLSARLLSQCLTSDNRNHIVDNGLDPVIRLACNFTTMKSRHSKRLLSRSMIMRQSSTVASSMKQLAHQAKSQQLESQSADNKPFDADNKSEACKESEEKKMDSVDGQQQDHSEVHAVIGTEILQHLFKHSEHTCSKMISLGALQAILYACRSTNIETLRHCASALVNLALYGGSDSQQTMIEHKAHLWLFPLAFNEDDNIQYYACLAIVVLVANQEIEADVLKSSTLNLVEPFVTSHEPQKFAESTTSHVHGQSASWLRKLMPLLESKRVEAQNLACFHFAMEAHIKREQGQSELFKQIGAIEALRKVGGSPQAIASRFACQALRLIGEPEPHRLSQQVPLWTGEDVAEWVRQVGFERFKAAFVESGVDGDLLLQLSEEMLKADIGMHNGIVRRRFLRELASLKRIADYSSVDKTNLSSMFSSTLLDCRDFVQYIYPMVQLGVTRDNLHLVDGEQLARDCNIANSIHRMRLVQAMKELQDKWAVAANSSEFSSQDGNHDKTLDVFVSYRRATGSQLASLLKVHLQLRGFSVFIDVERLEAGKFDNNLLDSIKTARNFILVLSPNALDRCIGDADCKDWVHKEIVAALASNCNIIPIMDNFHWPDAELLPEDMRSISYFNGVRWIHDYQDACVDKVERFIRGEIYNGLLNSSAQTSLQRLPAGQSATYCSTPSVAATPSASAFPTAGSISAYSARPPPFDADYHPLSFASQYLQQQHSQSSSQVRRP